MLIGVIGDLIVTHKIVIFDEHGARFRLDDGAFGLVTRKFTDRVHRLPKRDDEKLYASSIFAPQHLGGTMAGNRSQGGKHRLGDVMVIRGGGGLSAGETPPSSRNHSRLALTGALPA